MTSKKNSIFTDIVQIDGDPPPSYPIFDKFIFDKVLIMWTSLPPLWIFDKYHEILGFETFILYYPYYIQSETYMHVPLAGLLHTATKVTVTNKTVTAWPELTQP